MAVARAGKKKVGDAPRHSVFAWPWLKRPMRRFVLPGWTAITIGRRIFAWRPLDDVELAHELEHVRQWQRYGLRFIPRYLRESSRAAKAGGDRYHDNQFEREAKQAGEAARKPGTTQW